MTATLPVVLKVHDSVDVPEPPVTVVGLSTQATLSLVNATSAENPPDGVTVTVDTPVEPTNMVTLGGLALRLKSGTTTVVTAMVADVPVLPL